MISRQNFTHTQSISPILASFQRGAYQSFLTVTGIGEILSFAPRVTTDMLALYVVFLIGRALTIELGLKDNAQFGGILSSFAFLLMIPLIVVPTTAFVISFALTAIGVLPPLDEVSIPLGTPIIFFGWLTGGTRVAIFQVLNIFLQVGIYYPFAKVLDKQALKEEALGEQKETSEDGIRPIIPTK